MESRSRGSGRWAAITLGAVLALTGLVLVVGGGLLIAVGGSWYYLLAGLGLIASGVFLAMGRPLGVWIYAGFFVLTVLWAIWEVGLDGWALLPRVLVPLVLLALALAVYPTLTFDQSGRKVALFGLGGLALFVVVGGVVIAQAYRADPATAQSYNGTGLQALQPGTGADWAAYGGAGAQRYSPLNQITPDNIDDLERAWVYRTGDIPEQKWGAETTPLKIGDTVYLCSARNILIALDAATGEERWRYDPQVSDEWIPYTAACRGVVYYDGAGLSVSAAASVDSDGQAAPAVNAGAGPNAGTTVAPVRQPRPAAAPPATGACATRIIEGTLDGRLIAVDARSGVPCADFGTNGDVDIKIGMGRVIPGMVSMTSAPTIVRGVVVTGHQVLDGQRNDAPSGVIQGFDAVTGEHLWAWDLGQPGVSGRPPEGEVFTRGTPNMWTTASGDDELGLVFLPMGNSSADYYSSDRSPAENEYATALVALDVTTGHPKWNFQTVHIDVWDYDLGSQGTLVDFPTASGTVPAIILPSKQGDMYILDRRTGRPLTGVEERPVPQGGVEPGERTATQPYSLYHTLARPDLTEQDMWGMSPIDQMICRINFRRAAYAGMYTPPTADQRWIQYPGYNGGSDWGGIAVDPARGVIVANYNDMPNYNRLVPREEAIERGWFPRGDPRLPDAGPGEGVAEGAGSPQSGVPYAIDVNAGWRMPLTGLMCKQPPYGGIRAIELRTGRTLWDRPLGTARRNGPFGIPSMLPINIGTPNNGGSVVTAGGLVFIAAATDNLIRAIDIETGATVWSDVLPAGGQANPMMYEANGRQYLVIMAGGHHFMETPPGDYVIAYALPRDDRAD